MLNEKQSHDTFRMSTVFFESDDPDYLPPQYLRTGRHSSFINFAIFHLKCAGFDLGSSPEMEEGCEMLNDESFEKHVSQGEHEGNLEAAGDGFESDEETSCVVMPFLNRASLTSNQTKSRTKSLRMLLPLQEPLFECDLLPPFLISFVV